MSDTRRAIPEDTSVNIEMTPLREDHIIDRQDEEARLLVTEGPSYPEHDTIPLPQTSRRSRLSRWSSAFGNPRGPRIKPWLPAYQRYPLTLTERYFPTSSTRLAGLACFLLLWLIAFLLPLRLEVATLQDHFGQYVLNLGCIDRPWKDKNGCGLDGIDCRPFSNNSFAFQCPANCLGVQVWNPHAVGPLDIIYQPLVIGDELYRGDSFICGAAIHAGVITDSRGGCGRLTYVGQVHGFNSTRRHGIASVPFDSYFPLSYQVSSDQGIPCREDPRGILLAVSIVFTAILSCYTTSPSLQFAITFIAIFSHVGLVSDPPTAAFHNTSILPDHVSKLAERFLPAAFVGFVLYRTCVARTLRDLEAQIEKTIFWLGGFWIGALSNYTFDWIPIQRLTPNDLEQQPGAKLALVAIIAIISVIVIQQMYFLFLERRLLRYLGLYGLFLVGLLICLVLPGVDLRLHHYIFALILLPGTTVQTRSSLLYQGLLLGLFVNGVARWGFASILETPEMLRDDGLLHSETPSIHAPIISSGLDKATITFSWANTSAIFDAISVLVNDVERHRGDNREIPSEDFTWERPAVVSAPEYFRFAFMCDGQTLDYSPAGTWFSNGTWYMDNTMDTEQDARDR
ncbi:hypothetical protein NUW58_g1493 [Xylaria curta]|uniref:Uncharacterized protein n=1 Tax=Xylaria curta TaxID=42375 RepID=A0ACC1PKY4_9PEZI|nr:hypothetical protein NUW58_g1493 [Xylaria curta]